MEVGLEFDDRVIDILAGEQHGAAYRKVNPFGKVPALSVDGKIIVENVAILGYIDTVKPNILFPEAKTALQRAKFHADLVWCTATLHTAVRQVRMPVRYTDGDVSGVRQKGIEEMTKLLNFVEKRLANRPWWYGETWSIVDVYVNWGIMTAASTDLLPMQDFPAIYAHGQRVRERPSFRAALIRQEQAKDKAGLVFPDELLWKTDFSD